MKQIRYNVFETNSSSTHSLVICTKEDYDKFCKDELFVSSWKDELFTKEDVIEKIISYGEHTKVVLENMDDEEFKNNINHLTDGEFSTYEKYGEDFEYYDAEFTTPSGDKMVAFGYYGYDG